MGNLVKEVQKGVDNVTKEVSKGFNNVMQETGKGLEVVGVTTANIGNFVGGDVGKAVNAVTSPIGGAVAAGGSLVKGDIDGALARATAANMNQMAGNQIINSSSSLTEAAKHDTVNAITLGYSNDVARSNEAANRVIITGEASAQDWSTWGRTGVRTGVAVAAIAGGTAFAASETGKGFMGAFGAKAGAGAATVGGAAATTVGTTVGAGLVNEAVNQLNPADETADPQSPAKAGLSGGALAVIGAGAALVLGLAI